MVDVVRMDPPEIELGDAIQSAGDAGSEHDPIRNVRCLLEERSPCVDLSWLDVMVVGPSRYEERPFKR
ncbi:MAG: hypothetical protein JW751_11535 [Polyangiaceae bacterium]|nr:hypothetical protein [Polyangiaceae bacterium]